MAYHLASDDVLLIDTQNYAVELRAYYDNLVEYAAEEGAELDFSELDDAIKDFKQSADKIRAFERRAVQENDEALKTVVNHTSTGTSSAASFPKGACPTASSTSTSPPPRDWTLATQR